MSTNELRSEDILSDALEFLGGKPVVQDDTIHYGPLILTLPQKVRYLNSSVDHQEATEIYKLNHDIFCILRKAKYAQHQPICDFNAVLNRVMYNQRRTRCWRITYSLLRSSWLNG